MKQILIPAGEFAFLGNMEQLLQQVTRMRGILMADSQFRCVCAYPKAKGVDLGLTGRGGLTFEFRCRYEAEATGFRITYRVNPSFPGLLLLVFPFMGAYAGYAQFAAQGRGYYGLLAGLVSAAVCYPVFFGLRRCCIREFQNMFLEAEEATS